MARIPQETDKDKIIKAQRRLYSNQSDTINESNLTSEYVKTKPGTNALKDQPATKWRGKAVKQGHAPSQD